MQAPDPGLGERRTIRLDNLLYLPPDLPEVARRPLLPSSLAAVCMFALLAVLAAVLLLLRGLPFPGRALPFRGHF